MRGEERQGEGRLVRNKSSILKPTPTFTLFKSIILQFQTVSKTI